MNAVLAIIADGRRAIVVIYREAVKINFFLLYFIDSAKTLRWQPCQTPCEEAPRGAVCSLERKTAHHGGDVCVLVFS